MTEAEVLKKIIEIGNNELSIGLPEDINLENRRREEGIDSVIIMALFVYIENEFEINLDKMYEVDHQELTFKQMVELICEQIEVK